MTKPQRDDYHPYDQLPAFDFGITDYQRGRFDDTRYPADSVRGQAYDRGMDYAMRLARWNR